MSIMQEFNKTMQNFGMNSEEFVQMREDLLRYQRKRWATRNCH
ncbi:MAG: hypothetical protein ACO4AU_15330 [bacterium]|jgi:hypothetical protein